jgi:hypothetical protein
MPIVNVIASFPNLRNHPQVFETELSYLYESELIRFLRLAGAYNWTLMQKDVQKQPDLPETEISISVIFRREYDETWHDLFVLKGCACALYQCIFILYG